MSMPRCIAVVLLIAAAAISSTSADAAAEQRVVDWLLANGGEWNNLRVGMTPHGYRGVLATKDLKADDIMAVIPLNTTIDLPTQPQGDDGYGFHRSAIILAKMMKEPDSIFKAWFDSLPSANPPPLSIYTFPEQYVPLLNNEPMEAYLKNVQETVGYYWHHMAPEEDKKAVSYDEYMYGLALLSTRCFGSKLGCLLLPVVDMFNHYNLCKTRHELDSCTKNASADCEIWRVGQDYKEGEEVCFGYGGMFNDHSMVQYGFLSQPVSPEVFGIDRWDFDAADMWKNNVFLEPLPPFTANTSEGVWEEVKRLRGALEELEGGDWDAYMSPFAPIDKDGDILKLVLNWRELRQVALKQEVHRLLSLLRDALDVSDKLAVTGSGMAATPLCDCGDKSTAEGKVEKQQAEAAAAKEEEEQEEEEEEKDEL